MKTALLVIDIQNDYFPGGKMELSGPLEASEKAMQLLTYFRHVGLPAVFIQHIALKRDASFFLPGTSGAEIHANTRPLEEEIVIEKHFPNSFLETKLLSVLEEREINRLVICGMQTNMCVDATTRAASDLGFDCFVAADACAARSLVFHGRRVSAEDVHAAFLAALNGTYARVLNTEEIIPLLVDSKQAA